MSMLGCGASLETAQGADNDVPIWTRVRLCSALLAFLRGRQANGVQKTNQNPTPDFSTRSFYRGLRKPAEIAAYWALK